MSSKATHKHAPAEKLRCTLFTAVRNEAPFLVEWIAYHKAIGIDNIVVVSNDCTDGTTELLAALQDAGEITHIDHCVTGNQRAQEQASILVNESGLLDKAEWAIWLDADEFLNIHVGAGQIDDLISSMGERHGALLHWRLFGDGYNKRFGGRFISSDYVHAFEPDYYVHYHVKTFFRATPGQTFFDMTIHRPRLLEDTYTLDDFTTGDGVPLSEIGKTEDEIRDTKEFWAINGAWIKGHNRHKVRGVQKFGTFGTKLAQINHYAVRTPEYYALKRRRGNGWTPGGAFQENKRHDESYYSKHNGLRTKDKTILRHEEATTREMLRMRENVAVTKAEQSAMIITAEQIACVPVKEITLYECISHPAQPAGTGIAERPTHGAALPRGDEERPLDKIAKALTEFGKTDEISTYLALATTYKSKCFVLNFDVKGVVFGFDYIPNKNGSFEIDLRKKSSPKQQIADHLVTGNGRSRERVARGVSISDAKAITRDTVTRIASEILQKLNGS